MSRFTILGSRGFIGSSLVKTLTQQGYEVLTPHISACDADRNWGHVIYCIGLTGNYRQLPYKTVEAHVTLLSKFLKLCNFENLTYLSSTRLYLYNQNASADDSIVVKPYNPEDIYNISKLLGESLCLNIPRCKVVRLSNVIGVGMSSHLFLCQLITEALSGQIKLKSHIESVKDYISIQDVVKLLIQISLHGQKKLYNIASGRQTTHLDIYNMINHHYPCDLIYDNSYPKFEFPPINIKNIQEEFQFSPISIDNNIRDLVSNMQSKTQKA